MTLVLLPEDVLEAFLREYLEIEDIVILEAVSSLYPPLSPSFEQNLGLRPFASPDHVIPFPVAFAPSQT